MGIHINLLKQKNMLNFFDNKIKNLEDFLFGLNNRSIERKNQKINSYKNLKKEKFVDSVWIDKNDNIECISLHKPITRKLKIEPSEDVVAGHVYSQRLEKQFYNLNNMFH